MASGEDLVVVEDTCAEEASDRGNIPLPRFACRGTLGNKSDHAHGKAELYFKGMRRKVRAYLRTYDVCQRGKADTHLPRGKMGHLEIPVRKWESVLVDFISLPEATSRSSGVLVDEILTVMARATKMVVLIPCSS